MPTSPAIIVLGTFDSKAREHQFLKDCIEQRGFRALTINVGTGSPAPVPVSLDLHARLRERGVLPADSRDRAIAAMRREAAARVRELYDRGAVAGIVAAGGGTGTHLCTGVMRVLPLGVPKVMVSTVASRDMKTTVGTRDITMMHSVADLLGVNSISGMILEKAAAAVCAMTQSRWQPPAGKKRIALPFFGFITAAAEAVRQALEERGYEVIAFHANGTGGTAMEELAAEGWFDGILDLATHELADELKNGYCSGIGPQRLEPVPGRVVPRLVVPGGLDCAVLEFTRDSVPPEYRDRKIFYYDFRSAIRLNAEETAVIARQVAAKLNRDAAHVRVLIPRRGWSEADREGGPLHDPATSAVLVRLLKENLDPAIKFDEVDLHINDPAFGRTAAALMDQMVQG